MGYATKNSHITQVVENGLIDPTIIVTATEDAISRIRGSKDPMATFWKERKRKRVDIRGWDVASKAKLEAAFASAGALSFVHNILNRLESTHVRYSDSSR
ncbi:MAG: hypothetical protein MUO26_08775 [Methanotrichaceae archaeon]|nr:hypothetical protein [Methanotrichaceae archaeon]